MRIVFCRHGHPDYKLDCLTELGHRHAAAAAQRLKDEGITEIYASPMGRAQETAQYTADLLGLPIETLPFMREIRFRAVEEEEELPHNGNPWMNVVDMVAEGKSIQSFDWQADYPFCRSRIVESVKVITEGFDAWFNAMGYTREGEYYRVGTDTDKTIAIFSHAGSSTAAICRLFNLPYLYACKTLSPDFTGITVVSLSNHEGALVSPRFEIALDARHIRGIEAETAAPAE